jgi:hypothetical protein
MKKSKYPTDRMEKVNRWSTKFGSQESSYYGLKFENEDFPISEAIEIFKDICKKTHKNPINEYDEKYFNSIISWTEISKIQLSKLGTRQVN